MSLERKIFLTPAEYLVLERKAQVRSEYLDGDMVAMSGGSREHAPIIGNIVGELRTQLRGRPCEVYPSEDVGNFYGPDGPPPRMKELRLTARWLLLENRMTKRNWPTLKMVENHPVRKLTWPTSNEPPIGGNSP